MREWKPSCGLLNGEPGLIFTDQGVVKCVLCLSTDSSGERIQNLYLFNGPCQAVPYYRTAGAAAELMSGNNQ
ncbi:hypothetical protein ACFSQ7_19815 [Paenibacillus rhizoplanae]